MAAHRLTAPGRRAGGSPTERWLARAQFIWAAAASFLGLLAIGFTGWCVFRLLAEAGPYWPVPAAIMATTAAVAHALRQWARTGGAR
ncbi:hypothetical protein M8C13_04335 [Crossiella sp. SN42]|uniref:hypothetical protein n=1 Tax=Crossiella sp. SN42 TaxID=2944808 RepID=UPI00207C1739|nr:hypothetical protein [Crossiella sp. SN42]MCO1574986.1 hypothetical protein [Crossiella sp. SN42]